MCIFLLEESWGWKGERIVCFKDILQELDKSERLKITIVDLPADIYFVVAD